MRVDGYGTLVASQSKSARKGNDTSFAEHLAAASNTAVESFVGSLNGKYGVNIKVSDLSNKTELERHFKSISGHGNVMIAPNIIQEMLTDPSKMTQYEQVLLKAQKDRLANAVAGASNGTSSGIYIGSDGTVTEWIHEEPIIWDPRLTMPEAARKNPRGTSLKEELTAGKAAVEALAGDLNYEHGVDIAEGSLSGKESVSDQQNSATSHGDITAAPSILQDMLADPMKVAQLERELIEQKVKDDQEADAI